MDAKPYVCRDFHADKDVPGYCEGCKQPEGDHYIKKWRSKCPEGFDERVTIDGVVNGYAHCRYHGTVQEGVTPEDLERLFGHPQFGSRDVKIWFQECANEWRFSITRHLD